MKNKCYKPIQILISLSHIYTSYAQNETYALLHLIEHKLDQ